MFVLTLHKKYQRLSETSCAGWQVQGFVMQTWAWSLLNDSVILKQHTCDM